MHKPLRVGLAGLGTVGASLARLLADNAGEIAARGGRAVELVAVCARDRSRDRGVDLSAMAWFDSAVALAENAEIDVFVELIGGDSGPAEASVRAALQRAIPVVTANKALLAKHGVALARLAENKGVGLYYEAAAAGGIPIVRTLRDALGGNKVSRVSGIMNGTCNYILTRMENEGLTFDACLADAQALGYAEADPTFDVDGFDTAHKLAILTSLAFGVTVESDAIYVEGIRAITPADIAAARELGFRIKLLGVAQRTESGIEQRVHPTMVPVDVPIAGVSGVLNAVAVDADAVGELVLVGPGAGGDATASAVLGDLVDVSRGFVPPILGRPSPVLAPYAQAEIQTHQGGYYIRLSVFDRPGAFAAIAMRMAEHGISLESIVQRTRNHKTGPERDTAPQTVILITYETTETAVRNALDAIESDGHIDGAAQMIRIERL